MNIVDIVLPWRRIRQLENQRAEREKEYSRMNADLLLARTNLEKAKNNLRLVNEWIIRNHRTERMPDGIFSRDT